MINSIIQSKFKKLFIILFWISIWEIFALIINREIYLPSPFSTIKSLYELLFIKETYRTILYSSYRTICGFLISCIFGITLGYFCGINEFMYDLFNPLISVMRTVPVMSIIIIALMWFKDTDVPIFVAFLMCFPLIWTNTVAGIKNTDIKILQMCKVYNIKKMRILKSVYYIGVAIATFVAVVEIGKIYTRTEYMKFYTLDVVKKIYRLTYNLWDIELILLIGAVIFILIFNIKSYKNKIEGEISFICLKYGIVVFILILLGSCAVNRLRSASTTVR